MHIRARHAGRRQRGAFAVEFALVAMIFFALLCGVLELCRALYLQNTLQEVTRRAAAQAAVADFSNLTTMDQIRQSAVFRASSGLLAFGMPVTDQHVVIDYLALSRTSDGVQTIAPIGAGAMPVSPAANRHTCLADPNADNCIRLVRVRICMTSAGGCTPVPYQPLFPLIDLPINLPTATTITAAESLGYVAGSAP
jgi:hypothetical protein